MSPPGSAGLQVSNYNNSLRLRPLGAVCCAMNAVFVGGLHFVAGKLTTQSMLAGRTPARRIGGR